MNRAAVFLWMNRAPFVHKCLLMAFDFFRAQTMPSFYASYTRLVSIDKVLKEKAKFRLSTHLVVLFQ